MEEEQKEEFFTEPEGKEQPDQTYVPQKARAYHINQEAIEVCNGLERSPADTIVALRERVASQDEMIEVRDRMISSLKSIVPTDGRPVYTLQEFGDVMRKVCQTEGVMLHADQKRFFQELFKSLTDILHLRSQ